MAGGRGRRAEQQQHLLAAEAILGDPPSDDDREWWHAWIDIRDFRASRAYWLGETDEMEVLIASLDEPVRLHGTAQQRAEHHDTIASFLQRRDKYLPSQEVLDHKLAAAAATAELGIGARWHGNASRSGSPTRGTSISRLQSESSGGAC